MRSIVLAIVLPAIAALAAACAAPVAPPGLSVHRVADGAHPLDGVLLDRAGRAVAPDALVAALAAADVAVLGEIHDNPVHHQRQAWLVARLRPRGIAFEMVPRASEEGIAAYLAEGGTPGGIGPAIGWDRLGWPEWELYRPVFEAAAGAYVAGGGVALDDLRAAIGGGAAAVLGAGAAALGLDVALPPADQAALEAEMIAAHCGKLPAQAAPGMVEAQRLRDAAFATATLRARAMGGGAAVLITGNGHARDDRGVPAYLARAEPGVRVVTLGQIETVPGADRLADYAEGGGVPYDYVWFAPPAERPDPCLQFQ